MYPHYLNHQYLFIPFVRHVDSEDIANEKTRTNGLALEINKISLENETNTKISEHEVHTMATQSGDPNNKSKPAYKKYCSYCHKNNHGISNCYQKQRDDEYQRNKSQRSRTPQQSFVQYFRSKPNNSQENENTNTYSSNNDRNKYNQNYYNDKYRNNDRYRSNSRDYSQNNYRSNSRQRYYNTSRSPNRSRYESYYKRRTPSRSPYRSPHRNNLTIDTTLDLDTDLVLNHQEIPLDDIITHIDLHLDQETSDLDLEHPHNTDNKIE